VLRDPSRPTRFACAPPDDPNGLGGPRLILPIPSAAWDRRESNNGGRQVSTAGKRLRRKHFKRLTQVAGRLTRSKKECKVTKKIESSEDPSDRHPGGGQGQGGEPSTTSTALPRVARSGGSGTPDRAPSIATRRPDQHRLALIRVPLSGTSRPIPDRRAGTGRGSVGRPRPDGPGRRGPARPTPRSVSPSGGGYPSR
jgi:hypothetical protein